MNLRHDMDARPRRAPNSGCAGRSERRASRHRPAYPAVAHAGGNSATIGATPAMTPFAGRCRLVPSWRSDRAL